MKCVLLLVGLVLLISIVSAEHHSQTKAAGGGVAKIDAAVLRTAVQTKIISLQNEQKAGHSKKSGKKFSHEHEKSNKGKSEVVLHKKEDAEKGGKKHHYVEDAHHKSQNHKKGHGQHGASFKEGEHKKKANFAKGFREQYHKDEHKKTDNWFSNRHKSGEWIKFGSGKSKHHAFKHDKDSNGKYQAAKQGDKHMKEQKFASGHDKSDHKGHQSQHGFQQHHNKHVEYAKKKAHNNKHQ